MAGLRGMYCCYKLLFQDSLQFGSDKVLLCDDSFGLLEINGGTSLNFQSAQVCVSDLWRWDGESCPSPLQEVLLGCT